MEWQPIESAPKDGTVVLVKNTAMRTPVEAQWGPYHSRIGRSSWAWVLVRDPERISPRGVLVIPDVWMPLHPANGET